MKNLLAFLCAVTLVLGLTGIANALPYYTTWAELNQSEKMMHEGDIRLFEFDLTNDGFNPVEYDVTEPILVTLSFCHVYGPGTVEFMTDFGGSAVTLTPAVPGPHNAVEEILISIPSVIDGLSETGILGAQLTCTDGELYFNWGKLTVEGIAATPEPATMLLLGTGLVGLAGFGRKKLFKK